MRSLRKRKKNQIYFARPYRHLKPNKKERWLFLLVFVLPSLVIYLFFYTKISYMLSVWVNKSLSAVIPQYALGIRFDEFLPIFGGVFFIQLPTSMPNQLEIMLNLVITLLLLFVIFVIWKSSKGGTPLSIYFSIILITHLIACIYFLYAMEYFPYTATEYSELYIKQQVGIWLSFLILAGLIFGILGYGSIIGRLIAFLGTMTYSFIFGGVRYLTFMLILSKGSSLYMTTLFFSLGPLLDFLYLVSFYGIYINLQIKRFNNGKGRLKWSWL